MPVSQESIELLEYWLGEAKKGGVYSTAVACAIPGDRIAFDHAGIRGFESYIQTALKRLDQDLEAIQEARRIGPRDNTLDASYVEYNFGDTPINWDFLIWLIDAEMTRRREGAPAPLKVTFSQWDDLDKNSRSFVDNVFRNLLPLIDAVEVENGKGGRHKQLYTPGDIVAASRRGEEVPKLKASEKGLRFVDSYLNGDKPITITLREAPHTPHRNSNVEAWRKFAKDLEAEGEQVIFLRDTYKASDAFPGFMTFPIASIVIDARMALYEKAKLNFLISNGPCGLCLFSDVPYLYFVNLQENDPLYIPNDPEWWYNSNGVKPGEQWPWAKSNQKLIWTRDSYEEICKAWDDYKKG